MLAPRLRLSIKWLKRASSKEIPCLNKFYKIYNKHSIHFSSPQKAHAFRGPPELNKPFCLPCKGCGSPVETSAQSAEAPTEPTGETVGATCCTRRDCEKRLGHRVQAFFGAFCLLLGGVNCAKHKRHEAPNSFMNLAETVQCTVS